MSKYINKSECTKKSELNLQNQYNNPNIENRRTNYNEVHTLNTNAYTNNEQITYNNTQNQLTTSTELNSILINNTSTPIDHNLLDSAHTTAYTTEQTSNEINRITSNNNNNINYDMSNIPRKNYEYNRYNTTNLLSNYSTVDDLHTVNKIQLLYCDDYMGCELYDTYIQVKYTDKLRHIDIEQRYDKYTPSLIY